MKKFFLIIVFFCAGTIAGQSIQLNGSLGIGTISSNSPTQTSLDIEFGSGLYLNQDKTIKVILGYFNKKKIEYYLPENRAGKYYPSFSGVKLKGEVIKYDEIVDLSYSAGLLLLNDKMFEDRNDWTFGLLVGGGAYLLNNTTGLSVKIFVEYGLSFNSNAPSYGSTGLKIGYNF